MPVSAHPLFVPGVAAWFAALFGLGCLALGSESLEALVTTLKIDSLISSAAPPLGMKAKLLLAGLMALTGGSIGFALAKVFTARQPALRPRPQPRSAPIRPAPAPIREPENQQNSSVVMSSPTDASPETVPVPHFDQEDEDQTPARRRRALVPEQPATSSIPFEIWPAGVARSPEVFAVSEAASVISDQPRPIENTHPTSVQAAATSVPGAPQIFDPWAIAPDVALDPLPPLQPAMPPLVSSGPRFRTLNDIPMTQSAMPPLPETEAPAFASAPAQHAGPTSAMPRFRSVETSADAAEDIVAPPVHAAPESSIPRFRTADSMPATEAPAFDAPAFEAPAFEAPRFESAPLPAREELTPPVVAPVAAQPEPPRFRVVAPEAQDISGAAAFSAPAHVNDLAPQSDLPRIPQGYEPPAAAAIAMPQHELAPPPLDINRWLPPVEDDLVRSTDDLEPWPASIWPASMRTRPDPFASASQPDEHIGSAPHVVALEDQSSPEAGSVETHIEPVETPFVVAPAAIEAAALGEPVISEAPATPLPAKAEVQPTGSFAPPLARFKSEEEPAKVSIPPYLHRFQPAPQELEAPELAANAPVEFTAPAFAPSEATPIGAAIAAEPSPAWHQSEPEAAEAMETQAESLPQAAAEAPQSSAPSTTAADRIANGSLDSLSPVELVERLAIAMRNHRTPAPASAKSDLGNEPFRWAREAENAPTPIRFEDIARRQEKAPEETETALRDALATLRRMSSNG